MIPASTPGSPDTPTVSSVSSTSIQISWTFQNTRNGGTPITDYVVYWDNGINGNSVVASASTGLYATFTTAPGSVVAGTTYSFWVIAKNFVGTGTPSSKISVLASQIPDTPVTPTAVATYNSIQVSWIAPNS